METKTIIFIVVLAALVGTIAGYAGGKLSNGSEKADAPIKNLDSIAQRIDRLESELTQINESTSSQILDIPEQQTLPNSPTETSLNSLNDEVDISFDSDTNLEALQAQTVTEQATSLREIKQTMLLENGFTVEEADWVLQSESEANLDSLYDTYSMRKRAYEDAIEKGLLRKSDRERLREKLGDAYYERYLEANGLPTTPYVSQVIEGSPGDNSGLKSGDKIRSYDGQRVFNFRDITNLTLQGNEGESVLIEIERDGSPMQITIPRGPIGLVGGRGR